MIALLRVFVTQERIELNPGHVRFGDISEMAPGTLGHRPFRGGLIVGQWVMPESEEAPASPLVKLDPLTFPYVRVRLSKD